MELRNEMFELETFVDVVKQEMGRAARGHYVAAEVTVEPLDLIRQWCPDFLVGNVIKYLCRWKTDRNFRDLQKAANYMVKFVVDKFHELPETEQESIMGISEKPS